MRYVSGHHVAALHEREDYVGGWPPLSDIEQLVNESGAGLLDTWLARLQDGWREPVPVNMTRWSYLSDDLLEMLYDSQSVCQHANGPDRTGYANPGNSPGRDQPADGPQAVLRCPGLDRGLVNVALGELHERDAHSNEYLSWSFSCASQTGSVALPQRCS